MERDFTYVAGAPAHIWRRKEILSRHPEVKKLIGKHPQTALWVVSLVGGQWLCSFWATRLSWIWILLAAYFLGAFLNHGLYVLMHECTHNLIFKQPRHNKLLGLLCDFGLVFPGAMAFRKYHMMHHRYLGQYGRDPDIASRREARIVGHSPLGKALWLTFFSISQGLRPMSVPGVRFFDRWIAANFIVQLLVNLFIFLVLGPKALLYLTLSTFFALGLHPLGGRWIQEHYVTSPGQETYSYYGILNKVCFNMGFHNEHHDFANVAWNNLPRLKRLAPEYYDTLKSYRSWTGVVWNYVFNPSMSSYSRIVHPASKGSAPGPSSEGTMQAEALAET